MSLSPTLILASASPRRRQLLQLLDWHIEVQPAHVDETRLRQEDGVAMVQRLAALKAAALYPVWAHARPGPQRTLIVGADTAVEVDGVLLGKPADPDEALSFLGLLRARDHFVHSGLCVQDAATGQVCVRVHSARVRMRAYPAQAMRAYVASGAGMDKAGGYALQDRDFRPVAALEGCAASVMGLPLALLVAVCRDEFACSPPPGLCPDRCARLTGHPCCGQEA